jgi:hypothetical protein
METKPQTWIVELQEDPETGDFFMDIPLEVLESQGWELGDTLSWNYTETGDTKLTKNEQNQ